MDEKELVKGRVIDISQTLNAVVFVLFLIAIILFFIGYANWHEVVFDDQFIGSFIFLCLALIVLYFRFYFSRLQKVWRQKR